MVLKAYTSFGRILDLTDFEVLHKWRSLHPLHQCQWFDLTGSRNYTNITFSWQVWVWIIFWKHMRYKKSGRHLDTFNSNFMNLNRILHDYKYEYSLMYQISWYYIYIVTSNVLTYRWQRYDDGLLNATQKLLFRYPGAIESENKRKTEVESFGITKYTRYFMYWVHKNMQCTVILCILCNDFRMAWL